MLPYHDKARAHGTTPLLWRVGLALLLCCNTWAFYSLSRTTSDQLDHVIATLHGVENADRARSSAWSREVAGAVEHANHALASDLNGRLDSALTELAQARSALAQLQKQVDGGPRSVPSTEAWRVAPTMGITQKRYLKRASTPSITCCTRPWHTICTCWMC